MQIERVILGLIAAVLLPYSIPALRTKVSLALIASGLYAGYSLLPQALSWKPFVLIPLCLGATWGLAHVTRDDEDTQGSPRIFLPIDIRKYTLAPLGTIATVVLVTLVVYGGPRMLRTTRELVTDDSVAILASGFLIATFIGGEVVTHTLHPFSAELKRAEEEEMAPLKGAGTVIGWLERSLTYTLVVAGLPEAVLAVVGIKSLARFPELQTSQKRFAEYFLIGTMSSIGFAVLVAATIRIALGEKALV